MSASRGERALQVQINSCVLPKFLIYIVSDTHQSKRERSFWIKRMTWRVFFMLRRTCNGGDPTGHASLLAIQIKNIAEQYRQWREAWGPDREFSKINVSLDEYNYWYLCRLWHSSNFIDTCTYVYMIILSRFLLPANSRLTNSHGAKCLWILGTAKKNSEG